MQVAVADFPEGGIRWIRMLLHQGLMLLFCIQQGECPNHKVHGSSIPTLLVEHQIISYTLTQLLLYFLHPILVNMMV